MPRPLRLNPTDTNSRAMPRPLRLNRTDTNFREQSREPDDATWFACRAEIGRALGAGRGLVPVAA